MIFLLPLFEATFAPNLKFAYRELWPAGKTDPPPLPFLEGFEKPGPNRVNTFT